VLVEIYVGLMVVAFALMVVSFLMYSLSTSQNLQGFLRMNVFLPWIVTVMFFALSLSGGAVEYEHCETVVDQINITNNDTLHDYSNSYKCDVVQVEQTGVIWLFGGIGVIMMLFSIISIINTMTKMGGEIDDALQQ